MRNDIWHACHIAAAAATTNHVAIGVGVAADVAVRVVGLSLRRDGRPVRLFLYLELDFLVGRLVGAAHRIALELVVFFFLGVELVLLAFEVVVD